MKRRKPKVTKADRAAFRKAMFAADAACRRQWVEIHMLEVKWVLKENLQKYLDEGWQQDG